MLFQDLESNPVHDRQRCLERLDQAARQLISGKQLMLVKHAQKMKRGTIGRKYAASRLAQRRLRFWKCWFAMPENRYWPFGNPGKGVKFFLQSIQEKVCE